ncbi:hypothetical protein, unlikely [Trypanosoma congolense IL3000]|uniref:Uncharacterized protein n=1 Tax=Trypanosoma congolense (strain IL3000) TaxID=1068625 RepID=F9WIK5_TRYCI|nr:hypothetical protein, unlikely [Trypanosoma congolense IL3000]
MASVNKGLQGQHCQKVHGQSTICFARGGPDREKCPAFYLALFQVNVCHGIASWCLTHRCLIGKVWERCRQRVTGVRQWNRCVGMRKGHRSVHGYAGTPKTKREETTCTTEAAVRISSGNRLYGTRARITTTLRQ